MIEESKQITIGFCGTGEYSVVCAQALHAHPHFKVAWIITPPPKPVGRKKIITPTPLDSWASYHHIPVMHVETNLTDLKEKIAELPVIDYLLVVSFGYLIPPWLLQLPKIGAVNVHPSQLPKYRGSSPGQFALLYGEDESAVSIMLMNTKFDQGAIIKQLPFSLSPLENQESYYQKAFALAQENLPQILQEYAVSRHSTPQSMADLAPLARRLQREDGFIPQALIQAGQKGELVLKEEWIPQLGPALQELVSAQRYLSPAQLIDRALRAFTPWPGIWSLSPEYKGKKDVRVKILAGSLNGQHFRLLQVQYEGEAPQQA